MCLAQSSSDTLPPAVDKNKYREPQPDKMQRLRDLGTLSLKQNEPEMMKDMKKSSPSRYIRAYNNLKRLGEPAQSLGKDLYQSYIQYRANNQYIQRTQEVRLQKINFKMGYRAKQRILN